MFWMKIRNQLTEKGNIKLEFGWNEKEKVFFYFFDKIVWEQMIGDRLQVPVVRLISIAL